MPAQFLRGNLAALFTAVVWALTYAATKSLYEHVSPIDVIVLRFSVALVCLTGIAIAAHEPLIREAAMVVQTPEDFPYELLPGGKDYPWHSIPRKFYFYESSGGVIWGITAQMLYHCLKVIMREDAPAGGENRL